MKKICLLLTVLMAGIFAACGSDDDQDEAIDSTIVVIGEDGIASNGSRFVNIDNQNFYLDYIKYTLTDGHLTVTGYDELGLGDDAVIVSNISYKGSAYDVLEIGKGAFNGSTIKSIFIPKSIIKVGDSAFRSCRQLNAVHITDLSAWCKIDFDSFFSNPLAGHDNRRPWDPTPRLFVKGRAFTDLVIPDGVTSIGQYSFTCQYLTSVTIPSSVNTIGKNAFYECDSLSTVKISDLSAWCKIKFSCEDSNPLSWYFVNPNRQALNIEYNPHFFVKGKDITDLVIPDDIAKIEDYSFANYNFLTSISLGDGVTSIGEGAFKRCSRLTSITIPSSVSTIGAAAFLGCTGFTSITIPYSVSNIGASAFSGCTGLTSVDMSKAVKTIGSNTFYGCTSLTNITLPDEITQIGEFAFADCTALTDLKIPNSVIKVEEYAFENCSSMKDITIPDKVSTIGKFAFSGCHSLTSIHIGSNVKSIGGSAFEGCTNLSSIYLSSRPPEIYNDILPRLYNFTIYVPKKYESEYLQEWSIYRDYIHSY